MGSKKSKKRSRDDSEDSSSSDEDRAARKKSKKHKKEKKAHKEEKEKLKQAKKFLKQKLKEGKTGTLEEDRPLDPDAQIDPISSDSYFERNPEFTAWLREERGQHFNDLPTTEARALFEDFVHAWNSRALKQKYYKGISALDVRRKHPSWGIQGGSVESVKVGMAAALEEDRLARESARDAERAEVRKWKADQRAELDEMLPKATGREALVEKRIARREDARAREASPDVAVIPGGGDMYGDDDSFAAARSREANRDQHKFKRNAFKNELAEAKVREAEAREEEKMAKFRALIANGPIQIPKRT